MPPLPATPQAAWYVTLICCQFWHIWVCKTREVSIFTHGILRNPVTLWGVCVSVAVMLVVVYAPFLQVGSCARWTGVCAGVGVHASPAATRRHLSLCVCCNPIHSRVTRLRPGNTPHPTHAHQGIFGTAALSGIGWVPQIGALFFYLAWSEFTKKQAREAPDGWWARHMAW